MALDPALRDALILPAICAPMFRVSAPDLVREACRAGVIGGLSSQNVRTLDEFDGWLAEITRELDEHRDAHPDARIGPIAVNLSTKLDAADTAAYLEVCGRYGVRIVISATGNPSELIRRVHDWGGVVWADVTTIRHAEKAIAAGADGLNAIGAGGGGHSGVISHLALLPRIRAMFDGTLVLAGAVSTGSAIRAAEVLGADLAYLGTRFIATQEAAVAPEYKQLLVSEDATGLRYTAAITGVPANWLVESMRRVGLDPAQLPAPGAALSHDHLPAGVQPWGNLWSAGQGIELIEDLPTVAELVRRLRAEYDRACAVAPFGP